MLASRRRIRTPAELHLREDGIAAPTGQVRHLCNGILLRRCRTAPLLNQENAFHQGRAGRDPIALRRPPTSDIRSETNRGLCEELHMANRTGNVITSPRLSSEGRLQRGIGAPAWAQRVLVMKNFFSGPGFILAATLAGLNSAAAQISDGVVKIGVLVRHEQPLLRFHRHRIAHCRPDGGRRLSRTGAG